MQQMFHMVNILLNENPETRKRRLTIRGYKVIISLLSPPPPPPSSLLTHPSTSHLQATALAHPHHVLWQIFALSNGDNVPGSQRGKNRFVVDADKVKAAKGDNILFLFLY